ncbi:hypothetical protein AB0M43_07615 [Longispora sp. NPDC051575]|uniref:hypothetical protein n=1 Tax=Longispora sp. NPDC051575 TaxID=3154943 RepID=UPI0034390B04
MIRVEYDFGPARPGPASRPEHRAGQLHPLLRLQRAAGNSAVTARLARVVQRAADLRVTGTHPDAAGTANAVFFDRNSSTLTPQEAAKLRAFDGEPLDELVLRGTGSEDEAQLGTLIERRIDAVEAALPADGGRPRRDPRPEAAAGVIDYRRLRRVQVIRPEEVPPVQVSEHPDVVCDPPEMYHTPYARAVELLAQARGALSGQVVKSTRDALRLLFGSEDPAEVAAGLAAIETQLRVLRVPIPLDDPTAPGFRCVSAAYGGANVRAVNHGVGASARLTIGPEFLNDPSVDSRALTLIHEASHGTPGLLTLDHAYAWQRLLYTLPRTAALHNADSYTRLIQLIDNELAPREGSHDTATRLPPGDRDPALAAMALLEHWVQRAKLAALTLHRGIGPTGNWFNAERSSVGVYVILQHAFDLGGSPTKPKLAAKHAVAGIYDRLQDLRTAISGTSFTIRPSPIHQPRWNPAGAIALPPAFFALDTSEQRTDYLTDLVVTHSGQIEAPLQPGFIEAIKRIGTLP